MVSKFRVFHAALLAAILALLTVSVAAQRPVSPGKSNQAPGRTVQTEKKVITEAQKANVRERAALIAEIVDRHEAEAKALGMPADWKRPFYEALLPLSLTSIEAVEGAATLQELSVAAAAEAVEPQAIGSTTGDLVYTPIAACRFIDTRYMAAGRINGYRGFDLAVAGTVYGGVASCEPDALFGVGDNSFGALVINVTIVNPVAAPGWLAVKPTTTAPNSSWMNWYQAGATVQAANMGILTPDRSGANEEFFIQTSAATHVIVDITGAFLAPEATALDITTVTETRSVTAGATFSFSAACPVGRTMTGGGFNYSGGSGYVDWWQSGPSGEVWTCRGDNNTASTLTVYCYARCGMIPGR